MDCVFEDGPGFGLCCFNGCVNTCYQKNETKCTMESHQECHDETITEMVTETIMEQQCTGKVISIPVIRKIYLLKLHLFYHNFCR